MPLKKGQIEEFKVRLEEMRQHLTRLLEGNSADVKSSDDGSGYSQHQADQGTDDFGKQISLELSSNERQILQHIDRALEKIEEDSYGVCDISEEEIPIKRLEAVPYATTTVAAQEALERGIHS